MTHSTDSAFFILMLVGGFASAQRGCPSRPPAYELLRQDENYHYLSDPACRSDYWDHLKYLKLGSNPDAFITLGGEVREWYEGYHDANWGYGDQDKHGYLLQRLTIYSDIRATPQVRFFVQLTSDVEAGRNGGPRPMIDESKLFLEEAFADISLSKRPTDALTLRLGRQEFELGAGRLVDVREGPNVRQSFDGASINWKLYSWNIDAFSLKPVLNGIGVFDAPPDRGSTFWGVYAVHPSPKIKDGRIDLYYLGLARRDAAFDIGSADELRHTVGGRLSGGRGGWSYDSEAAFQWGGFGTRQIRAWGTGHDASYTFRSLLLKPRVGSSALVASGSHGDSESALGTLNPLFPTGYYFGQGGIALLGPSNLASIGPEFALQLTKSFRVVADDNVFWRTSLQDGIYGPGINLLISGRGNAEHYVGSQPSIGTYWNKSRHFLVSAAYAHFYVGSFLTNASPAGHNVNYAAVWTTYTF